MLARADLDARHRDIHTFCVLITQGALAHIGKLDRSLGTRIHEPVAALRMKFRRGDHLGQLFHVCRLDIDYVEALVLDVKVPEIDAKIVAADEGLPVTVDRYAVDVVCVGI